MGTQGEAQEFIEIGDDWPTGHPAIKSVALHECAHILQYRAYGYDYPALEAEMSMIYPGGTDSPVEHMADCMSEVMGAKRVGAEYEVGYGGECTAEQYAAGQSMLNGRRA
ncbi:hypothetical protein LG293_16915 (plasmid) [Citricoccus nitrophenolicus]